MPTKQLRIESRAPTRIDLAGGTVDIWPLYLLLDRACTINLGINLFAEAQLEFDPAGPGGILLESRDQGATLNLKWSELPSREFPPQLALHGKLLRHFVEETDGKTAHGALRLRTQAKSPAGAGLGGSSTLSVAMIGALAKWARGSVHPDADGDALVAITRDIETTVIQVPAGVQDYYGAMFGGLQGLHWGVSAHRREAFSQDLIPQLARRLVLFYSGQSRNSGINNWALFKGFIDGQNQVRERFSQIVEATHRLGSALRSSDWEGVGDAIRAEWAVRRTLAPGISTPEMDRAFRICEEEFRGTGKICGAGGGGCFFLYLPSDDPQARQTLTERVLQEGGGALRTLEFEAVPHGLEVVSH
jgi:D-glycero-alpha-D-manno-heptose-7-phosphate kinase